MSKRKRKRKHRRNRRGVSQSSKRRQIAVPQDDEHVILEFVEYEITFEALQNRDYQRLPSEVKDQIEELHETVHQNPDQAIPPLEHLIDKYPYIPQLYNFLGIAYSKNDEPDKAEAIVKKNYEQNPDYLFAKCNYAEICLQKGEIEKIPILFDNRFNLKVLYPHRNKFHISEVVGFAGIMGMYFCAIDEVQTAKVYYDTLKQLVPRHPMTKQLKRAIHPSLAVKTVRKLASPLDTGDVR